MIDVVSITIAVFIGFFLGCILTIANYRDVFIDYEKRKHGLNTDEEQPLDLIGSISTLPQYRDLFLAKDKKIKLDIGCGNRKRAGFIGIDKFKGKEVNIVLDVEKTKLPFKDNSVDFIFAGNVFEHIKNLDFVIKEIHRVLKPYCCIEIITPYYQSFYRIHFFHVREGFSWDYFSIYSKKKRSLENEILFEIVKQELIWRGGWDLYGIMPKIAKWNYRIYERWLSHFFPARNIKFILRKLENVSQKQNPSH